MSAPPVTEPIDVPAACSRIAEHVRRTPVVVLEGAALDVPGPVALKLELLQHTGSFKARGAFNRILSARAAGVLPDAGVIAASGGNHGLAVGHAARQLGLRAEVFVPEASSPVKIGRVRATGAQVTVTGALYADAYDACLARARDTGALFVHAYDQPEVVAGQGTVAVELLDQVPEVDTVVVAVGGGGLSAGIAAGLAGRARLVAVEPARIPTLHDALEAGHPVDVEVSGVASDSLGAKRIGSIAYDVLSGAGVTSVLVEDEAIMTARQRLWDEARVAAEHGGATAVAALTSGGYAPEPGERVAVVVCGGNTDPADLVTRPERGAEGMG